MNSACLNDISVIISGNSIPVDEKKKLYTNIKEGLPYIATKDISFSGNIDYDNGIRIPNKFHKKFKLAKKNSILICAEGGSAGRKVAFNTQDCFFVNKLFSISPQKEILPKYLYYYILSNSFKKQFNKALHGLIGGVSLSKIRNFNIKYPSIDNQKNFIQVFEELYLNINKLIVNIGKKKEQLQQLFDQLLLNEFNNNKYKKHKLGTVCKFVGGSQPAKSYFEYKKKDTNIRLIQIRDYKSDKNIVYIPKAKAKRFCVESDIMIGRYGPPLFQILRGIKGSYNVALMKAIPEKEITNDYLFFFLKNKKIQDYVIKKSSRAAGQSGVNKETLEPYEINLPHILEQNKIVKKIKFFITEKENLKDILNKKKELLDALRISLFDNLLINLKIK